MEAVALFTVSCLLVWFISVLEAFTKMQQGFWKSTPSSDTRNITVGCNKHQQMKANGKSIQMRAAEPGNKLCLYSGPGSGSRNESGPFSGNVLLIAGIVIAVLAVLAVVLFLMMGGLKRNKGHGGAKKTKSHSKRSKRSKRSRRKTSSIKKHNTSRGGGHSIGNKSNKSKKLPSSKHSSKKSRLSQSKKAHSQKHLWVIHEKSVCFLLLKTFLLQLIFVLTYTHFCTLYRVNLKRDTLK